MIRNPYQITFRDLTWLTLTLVAVLAIMFFSKAFGGDPRLLCERGRIGEQQLHQVQSMFENAEKGDYVIKSECWRAVESFAPGPFFGAQPSLPPGGN